MLLMQVSAMLSHFSEGWRGWIEPHWCRYGHLSRFVVESCSEDQAIGRAHRMGQEQNVEVYRMITRGMIEEKIQELQASKDTWSQQF